MAGFPKAQVRIPLAAVPQFPHAFPEHGTADQILGQTRPTTDFSPGRFSAGERHRRNPGTSTVRGTQDATVTVNLAEMESEGPK